MIYDPKKCNRLKNHKLAHTCRACMEYRYWCDYCVKHTDYEDWEYANRGPYCTTCGRCHGQGDCAGPD